MRATTGFLRLFIRGLAWDATDSESTFVDTLKTAARARLTDSAKGKVLTGVGQGGATISFSLPPLGDLTGQDLAEACSKLLDYVDVILAENSEATDAQILAALLAHFQPIRSVRPDFSRR